MPKHRSTSLNIPTIVLAAFCALCAATTARATNQAVGQWRAPGCTGPTLPAQSSIVGACQAAATNCGGTYTGVVPSDIWYAASCKWSGALTSGQQVTWNCYNGGTRKPYFQCVVDPDRRERPACQQPIGSLANVSTPNPINLLTGSKVLNSTDFETADGLFAIKRSYRSRFSGEARVSAAFPKELGLGWRFDFAPELHISSSFSSGAPYVTLHWPDGTAYDFIRNSSGGMDPVFQPGIPFHNLRLSFVGTWPSNLSTVPTTQTNWAVVDGSGNTWELQSYLSPVASPAYYNVARPTTRTTRAGYQWFYTYSTGTMKELQSITDSFSRTFNFTWIWHDPQATLGISGQPVTPEAISEIDLPDGTSLRYSYTPLSSTDPFTSPDILSKVERLDATSAVIDSTEYHHEDTDFVTFITGITDGRGIRSWNYSYNSNGRATVSERPGGIDKYSVSYSTEGGNPPSRTVTNPLGRSTVYRYSDKWTTRLVGVDGQATSSCPADFQTISYFTSGVAIGYISSTTDQEGRVTNYTRDSRGRPLTITEAAGTSDQRVTTITWDSSNDVPLTIVKPGLTTTYTYNSNGRVATITQTDTTTHTVPYTTAGRTRTWTYTYTTEGLIDTVDGPLVGTVDVIDYDYDADGYLTLVTNELGQATDIVTVNGRGQPTEILDPNGVTTRFGYDDVGRLESILRNPGPDESETTFDYDGAGDLTRLTRADGSWLNYSYDDAQRVTLVENDTGEKLVYGYNASRQVTSVDVKSASGAILATRTAVYDELMRIRQAIGAGLQATLFTYDKVNNPDLTTTPRGKVYDMDYDRLNRLVKEVGPATESAQTLFAYDARDNFTSVTDARSLVTTYTVDGFGDVIRRVSPDTGTTDFVFNEHSLATSMTDARGVVVNFTYDELGRVESKTFPSSSSEDVTYVYDNTTGGNYGVGRLTSVTNESGTTNFTYNALGNLVGVERTFGSQVYATAYDYDAAGRVIGVAYPSGRIVSFYLDSAGRVIEATTREHSSATELTVAIDVTYQPFYPANLFADGAVAPALDSPHLDGLESLTYGNGLDLLLGYDQDGRLTDMQVSDGTTDIQDLSLGYDDSANVKTIADNLTSALSQSFDYDDRDRLEFASGAYGDIEYDYDKNSNRTLRVVDSGTIVTETYTYPSTSNRLSSVTVGSSTRAFGYTASGSIQSDTRTSATFSFTYNHNGRMSSISAPAGPMAARSYKYDVFGHRVSEVRDDRVGGSVQTSGRAYVYDLMGRLIAEYDENTGSSHAATLTREYIWLGDMPVALIAASQPNALMFVHTDHLSRPQAITDGTKAVVWEGSYDPFGEEFAGSIASSIGAMPLRFPGQEWDAGSNLSHSSERDYDPTLGRFLESDPSLTGGQNSYGFKRANPLSTPAVRGFGISNPSDVIPLPQLIPWPGLAAIAAAAGPGAVAIGGFAALYKICEAQDAGDPLEDECMNIYNLDVETCRELPKGKRRACYAQAAERLGNCLAARDQPPGFHW